MQTCIRFGTPKWCSDVFESSGLDKMMTLGTKTSHSELLLQALHITGSSILSRILLLLVRILCLMQSRVLPNHKQLFYNHQLVSFQINSKL
jgi:hypothetical protein